MLPETGICGGVCEQNGYNFRYSAVPLLNANCKINRHSERLQIKYYSTYTYATRAAYILFNVLFLSVGTRAHDVALPVATIVVVRDASPGVLVARKFERCEIILP